MSEDPRLTPADVQRISDAAASMLLADTAVLLFARIGSSVYLANPRDVDFIVLVAPPPAGQSFDTVQEFCDRFALDGWEHCGEYTETLNGWNSIRKDSLNLIVSADPAQYKAYKAAMEVCKALRLTDKADRRLVCRIMRDELTEEEARGLAASKSEGSDVGTLLPEFAGAVL